MRDGLSLQVFWVLFVSIDELPLCLTCREPGPLVDRVSFTGAYVRFHVCFGEGKLLGAGNSMLGGGKGKV